MALSTGTAASLADFIGKLITFATANGWTANVNNWPTWVHLSNGVCNISMREETDTFNDALGDPRNDRKIRWSLTNGFAGSGPGITGQVDTAFTANANSGNACNDMNLNGGNSYWLFTDGTYIHCVIESDTANHYNHLSFGNLIKTGLTYTGGAYAYSHEWTWWPNNATYSLRADTKFVTVSHKLPFVSTGSPPLMLFVGDANSVPMIQAGGSTPMGLHGLNAIGQSQINGARFADSRLGLEPAALNGQTSFQPMYAIIQNSLDTNFHIYLGQYPDVRFVSMKERNAEEIVTIGADNWYLFPFRRVATVTTILEQDFPAQPGILNTSGNYGFAIKA